MINSRSRRAQCAQQAICQHLVIFGDQYAHAPSPLTLWRFGFILGAAFRFLTAKQATSG
jgi:hypothetical protein